MRSSAVTVKVTIMASSVTAGPPGELLPLDFAMSSRRLRVSLTDASLSFNATVGASKSTMINRPLTFA
jgi:hypothetical protein